MITAPTLAKTAAPATTLGVPARGNVAVESIKVTSSRKQIAIPNPQLEVSLHEAAESDDAQSPRTLWRITLGILIYAVVAAVITIFISN